MNTRLVLAACLCCLLATVSTSAQTTLIGDRLRLNAGPCVLTSTAGSPDTLVLTGDCSKIGTSAATNLTLAPSGDLVLAPAGVDVLPNTPYTVNLGMLSNKYLTLHAAELWVETLVAQNTIATIGGRVLVAPTNILTLDFAPGNTFITVKYNNLVNGDRLYMEADGKVEFMAVASTASGGGPYVYTVTRNLDGTGANQWYAGDAILNTGTTGNGFIDLYSTAGVLSTGSGPSIVGNVRTGTTYNAYAPRWAIGNLNGLYGYASSIYGTAFGDPSATNVTADATNGFRIRSGTTNKFVADTAGNLSIVGDLTVGTSGIIRSAGASAYGSGTGFWIEGGTTPVFRVGVPGAAGMEWDGTGLMIRGRSGSGANQIRNSACHVGTEDWTVPFTTATTPTLSSNFAGYRLNDVPGTCYVTEAGTPANGTYWFPSVTVSGARFPVQVGNRYEASSYINIHRINQVYQSIGWYNAAGAPISGSDGNICTVQGGGSALNLVDYCRTGVVATAPAGAVTAWPQLVAVHNGAMGANPFLFITRAFFGEATGTQTLLSEWGPAGVTEITGGLIKTGTIVADHIAAATITGGKIAAGTITAGNIAANTITAGQIASATITATQIAASTITANEIAASTITGAKIAATTITAGNLNVSSLSAITANLGAVTAGSINVSGGGGNFSLTSNGDVSVNTLTVASNLTSTLVATFNNGISIPSGGINMADAPGGLGGERYLCISNDGTVHTSVPPCN